jgi:hypothetical protein
MLAQSFSGRSAEVMAQRLPIPDVISPSEDGFLVNLPPPLARENQLEMRQIFSALQTNTLSVPDTVTALNRFFELACTSVPITHEILEFLFTIIVGSPVREISSLALKSARWILLHHP